MLSYRHIAVNPICCALSMFYANRLPAAAVTALPFLSSCVSCVEYDIGRSRFWLVRSFPPTQMYVTRIESFLSRDQELFFD